MTALGMQGYKEAERIDAIINLRLAQDPITKDNAHEWLKFARVVLTSCNIIEFTAIGILKGGDTGD